MQRFTGLLGLAVVMSVAYLFSNDRRAIQPRVIFWGLGLQISFAFLVLKTPIANWFKAFSNVINHLLGYSIEGSKFVFGDKLGSPDRNEPRSGSQEPVTKRGAPHSGSGSPSPGCRADVRT